MRDTDGTNLLLMAIQAHAVVKTNVESDQTVSTIQIFYIVHSEVSRSTNSQTYHQNLLQRCSELRMIESRCIWTLIEQHQQRMSSGNDNLIDGCGCPLQQYNVYGAVQQHALPLLANVKSNYLNICLQDPLQFVKMLQFKIINTQTRL